MIGIVAAILYTIQCLALVLAILPTERALKRTFIEEGVKWLLYSEAAMNVKYLTVEEVGLDLTTGKIAMDSPIESNEAYGKAWVENWNKNFDALLNVGIL